MNKISEIDISIIIVSYNTASLTVDCIDSIYKHTKSVRFDICVIDNNSSDNSSVFIRQKFPEVKLIELSENLGFGAACNIGVNLTNSKYILFLNSDTLFINNCLLDFFNYFEANINDNIGIIGGKLVNGHGQVDVSYGNFPSLIYEFFTLGFHKFIPSVLTHKSPAIVDCSNTAKKVDYIIGADMFLLRDVFDVVGGFDTDFFLYYEETHLSHKFLKAGFTSRFVPSISMVHLGGSSNTNIESRNQWLIRQLLISKFIYFHKVSNFVVSFSVLIVELLKEFLRNPFRKDKFQFSVIISSYIFYIRKLF